MKKVTYFIDPVNNRINGYTYKIYISGETIPAIPRFLVDENGQTTGIMYVEPICVITGYNPELQYKTYHSETNSFV
jgi:hypothetical protein